MIVGLLIAHGLVAVALLGAITHQLLGAGAQLLTENAAFWRHYHQVRSALFTNAVTLLFGLSVLGGLLLYPVYRMDARIHFEQMGLSWAIGLFELKEHFGAIGLATLPLYRHLWRPDSGATDRARLIITGVLAFIVWWNFLIGHILNNIRGVS